MLTTATSAPLSMIDSNLVAAHSAGGSIHHSYRLHHLHHRHHTSAFDSPSPVTSWSATAAAAQAHAHALSNSLKTADNRNASSTLVASTSALTGYHLNRGKSQLHPCGVERPDKKDVACRADCNGHAPTHGDIAGEEPVPELDTAPSESHHHLQDVTPALPIESNTCKSSSLPAVGDTNETCPPRQPQCFGEQSNRFYTSGTGSPVCYTRSDPNAVLQPGSQSESSGETVAGCLYQALSVQQRQQSKPNRSHHGISLVAKL